MHWSFEKYWFTRLCRSFKRRYILLYNILKITFPIYSRFQKFQLVLQNSDFITWQQMLPVVFLEATGPLLSFFFEKVFAKYSSLNIHSGVVLMKKEASSV